IPLDDPTEAVGAAPGARAGPEFFDDSFVHTVALTLSDDALDALGVDPYTYVEGSVTVDGVALDRVGVRLRGKIGSFRDLSAKPKWKIDLNRFVPGQRLGDHEVLALNNTVVDCSWLREPTGYALFRQVGIPAPRTAYTHVTLNGEDYGLYVAVEFPDDRFLARHYPDPTGNLYDGKYRYSPRGDLALVDFTHGLVDNFQLEEGVDNGGAEPRAITDALTDVGSFDARLGDLVDLDVLHRYLAAEQWIGQLDGYALNTNNYRVYVDPADGRADLLPYDLDYAFYDAETWGMGWREPRGALASACWRDTGCVTAHADTVADVVAEVDTDALLARIDAWTALIDDAARDDPRRECPARRIAPEQAALRAWVETGSARLASAWGG
ncbi:MAG: CotH kinase family protein, partial [Myxococcota bacterium]